MPRPQVSRGDNAAATDILLTGCLGSAYHPSVCQEGQRMGADARKPQDPLGVQWGGQRVAYFNR